MFEIEQVWQMIAYLKQINVPLVGFNNILSDDLILKSIEAYHGDSRTWHRVNTRSIYLTSKSIIEGDPYDNRFIWDKPFWGESIDCLPIEPLKGGLKKRGGLYGWPKLQDLPYNPHIELTEDQKEGIRKYCKNDVLVTEDLYHRYQPDFEFRKELNSAYGLKVTNKSKGGVCEAYFKRFYGKPNVKSNKDDILHVKDMIPDWVNFKTSELQEYHNYLNTLENTHNKLTKLVNKEFNNVFGVDLQVGAGGIHTVDSPLYLESTDEFKIIDIDVRSFYPYIMLNNKIKPRHLEDRFFNMFKDLVDKRVKAKKNGEKDLNEGLKIVINSAYGKMQSEYSMLFDPFAQLSVTLTGQLGLTMLAEMLYNQGITLISMNTDGISCKVNSNHLDKFRKTYKTWEQLTGFDLEEIEFLTYARRDVNNYLAIPKEGDTKLKGVFQELRFGQPPIIGRGLQDYYNGESIDDTFNNATIVDFAYIFQAKKGWNLTLGEKDIQSISRWYVGKQGQQIVKHGLMTAKMKAKWDLKNPGEIHPRNYIRGMKIAHSVNAVLINDLPDYIPDDIDFDYYKTQIYDIIEVIDATKK